MELTGKNCHCEDCKYFDDDKIPTECKKGNGKVSFMHAVCSYFKQKPEDLGNED